MSRIVRSRPNRLVKGVVAAAAAVLLAGCGAGQLTGTSTQGSSPGGAAGAAGNIVVRDAGIEFGHGAPAAVVYPAQASAPVSMHIVNQGYEADRLLSADSAVAASVQVTGATEVPGGQSLVVGSGAPSALPGTQATQITLVGLKDGVYAGKTYPLVLTFEKAGRLSLNLPVDNPTTPREPATE